MRGAPLCLVVALGVLLVAPPSRATRQVEIYEVRFRIAEELVPLARAILDGPDGVALDRTTNSLVLIGPPEQVAEAIELLSRLDRPPRTIELRYTTLRRSQLDALGLDVRWSVDAGNFRIGNVTAPAASGTSLEVRVRRAMEQSAEPSSGTLHVTEGARTRIETGTRIPYAQESRRGASTVYVDAATGFEARARVRDDGAIEVDLASFADRLLGPQGSIASTQTSTLVTLRPGETRVVGGINRTDAERRTNATRGAHASRRDEELLLLLRAEVGDTPPAGAR